MMELARIPRERRDDPRGRTDLVVSLRSGMVEISSGPWSVRMRRGDIGEVMAALERARLILASDNPPRDRQPEGAEP